MSLQGGHSFLHTCPFRFLFIIFFFISRKMANFCRTIATLITPLRIEAINSTWELLEAKFCEMVPWRNLGAPRAEFRSHLI